MGITPEDGRAQVSDGVGVSDPNVALAVVNLRLKVQAFRNYSANSVCWGHPL